MQFDFLTLEVDGSLRNPVVVFVVALWAGVLAIASMVGAFAWYRSRQATTPSTRGRGVVAVVAVAFLYVATPIAQEILGNMAYAVQSRWDGGPEIISVGFWGGPPLWPAPVFGLAVAFVALRYARRAQERRLADDSNGASMTNTDAVHAALDSLIGAHSIASAILATEDGEVRGVAPTSKDAWEAAALAEWALEQVEQAAGLRNITGEPRLSLLVDPPGGITRVSCHVETIGAHILLVMFEDRDCLGSIRKRAREVAQQLERILLAS